MFSASLEIVLAIAYREAVSRRHAYVTLEHLLLAFTEDTDASAVLQASSVDLVRLGTDVSGYLGRLLEDMRAENGAEPATDPELLRVLHAAVQAAQQSRRRQIDGAIVLAAVVGDGKPSDEELADVDTMNRPLILLGVGRAHEKVAGRDARQIWRNRRAHRGAQARGGHRARSIGVVRDRQYSATPDTILP